MGGPPGSSGSTDRLVRWLDGLRRWQAAADLGGGLASGLAAALFLLTLLALLDGVSVLARPLRLAGVAASLGLLLFPAVRALRGVLSRGRGRAARQAEAQLPSLRRQLSLAESLVSGRLPVGTSRRMAEGAADRARELLSGVWSRSALRTDPLRRGGLHLLLALLTTATALLLFPAPLRTGGARLAHPAADHRAAYLPDLALEREAISAQEGSAVRIRALLRSGPMPDEAELLWRAEGSDFWRPEQMSAVAGTLAAELVPAASGRFYVRTPRARTGEGTLTLLRHPYPDSLQVLLRDPSYAGGGERTLRAGKGDIEALRGSRVTVRTRSPVPLERAWIELRDDAGHRVEEITMAMEPSGRGDAGTGSFRVGGGGSWSLGMQAVNGLRLERPVRFAVRVREDEPPRVDLLEPASDGDLTEEMLLPLLAVAADDIRVARLGWAWRVVDRREEGVRWMQEPGTPAARSEKLWDLAEIDLMPGDRMEVWAVAEDDDPYGGPNRGESERRLLRLPTIMEVASSSRQGWGSARQQLAEAAGDQEEAGRALQQLVRRLRAAMEAGSEELDWEGQQTVEGVLQAQEGLEEALERVASAASGAARDLGARRALSEQTLQKLQAVREAMERILTPRMEQSMERLRQALAELDARGLLDAAEESEADLGRLDAELERLLELLRAVEAEQRLDVLAAAAADAAARQRAIAGVLEDTGAWEEQTGRRQAYVASAQQRIEEMLAEAASGMADRSPAAARVLEATSERARQVDLAARLEQLARRLSAAGGEDPAPPAAAAASDLAAQAKGVEEARRVAREEQAASLDRLFERTAADLLHLAEDQGRVRQEGTAAPREALLRAQGELGRAGRQVSGHLERAAASDPFLAPAILQATEKALRRIETVGTSMQQDRPWRPRAAEAVAALNEAAMRALEASDAIRQRSSSGSGRSGSRLDEALSQAAEQQARLAEQAAGMGGAGWEEMSMEERAEVERLSRAQRDLAAELRRLERSREEEQQVLGDLEALARQMEEVAGDLRQRGAPPEVVERQERILSRLLDAGRALRSRPSEGGRQAERARGYIPSDPGALGPRRQDPLEEALRRALGEGYTIEYERLIRRYFERLKERRGGGGVP